MHNNENSLVKELNKHGIKGDFPLLLQLTERIDISNPKIDTPIEMKRSKCKLDENIPFYKPISRSISSKI